MKELDIDVFKLENEDIQDARRTFSGDWTPKIFAMTIVIGFPLLLFSTSSVTIGIERWSC